MLNLIEEHGLDIRLCYFGQQSDSFGTSRNTDTIPFPDTDEYNDKVEYALEQLKANQPSFAIIYKGRHENEKSCIWVEECHFYAMGYIDSETDLNTLEDIKGSLERYSGNYYMMQLIESFARKNPRKIVWASENNANTYEKTVYYSL